MPMTTKSSETEFIVLLTVMTSLGALSIDTILPALQKISESFALVTGNSVQMIIGILFLGMTIGQLIYGPLSDSIGRKPVLLIGIAIFMLGSLMSVLADSFDVMLTGRFFQGFGAAALRIVPLAIVRDKYEGASMARIMSLSMSVFIMIPIFAPLLGQSIISIADWRAIFWFLFILSFLAAIWIWLRQPETLSSQRRNDCGLKSIQQGLSATLSNKKTCSYIIALGLLQGVFMGYIMSAEQIYREFFNVGEQFVLYFALAAASIGIASVLNARLVKYFDLEKICFYALLSMIITSGLICIINSDNSLSLMSFMIALSAIFFCFGLLMGNMNAIALKPLGHIAGLANSTISFISGCIALLIGSFIGGLFNMSVQPLMFGVLAAGMLSIIAITSVKYFPKTIDEISLANIINSEK